MRVILAAVLLCIIIVAPAAYAQTNSERIQDIQDGVAGVADTLTVIQSALAGIPAALEATLQAQAAEIHAKLDALLARPAPPTLHEINAAIISAVDTIDIPTTQITIQDIRAGVAAELSDQAVAIAAQQHALDDLADQLDALAVAMQLQRVDMATLTELVRAQNATTTPAPAPAPTTPTAPPTPQAPGTTLLAKSVTYDITKSDLEVTKVPIPNTGGSAYYTATIDLSCSQAIYPTGTSVKFVNTAFTAAPEPPALAHGVEYVQVEIPGDIRRDLYNSNYAVSTGTNVVYHRGETFTSSAAITTPITYHTRVIDKGGILGTEPARSGIAANTTIMQLNLEFSTYYAGITCNWGDLDATGTPTPQVKDTDPTHTILHGITRTGTALITAHSSTITCTAPAHVEGIVATVIPEAGRNGIANHNTIDLKTGNKTTTVKFDSAGAPTISDTLPHVLSTDAATPNTLSGNAVQGMLVSITYKSSGTCAIQ